MFMREIIQALVIIFLAIPFIYMIYDISRELLGQFYRLMENKMKPALAAVMNFISN